MTVIEANDLVASSDGKSDPFCVVKIGEEGQEGHTPVVKNTLNPHWNYAVSYGRDTPIIGTHPLLGHAY